MTTSPNEPAGAAADAKRRTEVAPAKPADAPQDLGAADSAAVPAGGFTVLPSLRRVASGPVCENGVCYVPGAEPVVSKPEPKPKP